MLPHELRLVNKCLIFNIGQEAVCNKYIHQLLSYSTENVIRVWLVYQLDACYDRGLPLLVRGFPILELSTPVAETDSDKNETASTDEKNLMN